METRTVMYGDKEVTFRATAYLVNGEIADRGQAFADPRTVEDALNYANRMLTGGSQLGSYVAYVDITGAEWEFMGHAWVRTNDYTKSSFCRVVNPNPPPLTKADLKLMCYDTTVMDYFETVHERRSDGSCKCGKYERKSFEQESRNWKGATP